MRGGKAEKETKGGERGRRGKVVVHSTMCVLQPCVEGQKKRREGKRGRERERDWGRKERKLKTLPLCWQVLDDSSDIKVFSLTGDLLCV